MLADSELERVLVPLRSSSGVPELVEGAVKRLAWCPICTEPFSRPDELTEHLRKCHADRLVSSGWKQITDHCVKEGDDRIFICPHDGWAVGFRKDSHVNVPNPTSAILDHLKDRHRSYPLLFRESSDVELIVTYLRNLPIAHFPCSQCDKSFGSAETLARHLTLDHSSARPEDLTEEQLQPIRLAAERVLDRRRSSAAPPRVFPAPTRRAEVPKPTTPLEKAEPAQIAGRQGDIARPRTPIRRDHAALSGQGFSRTIRQREIDAGFLVLPTRLSSCLGLASRVAVHLAGDENATVLSFDPLTRCVKGLTQWFHKSALEAGDRIKFRLLRAGPPEILMWTEWEKHLNYVLRCPALDFKWEHFPIRDCLIKVFADHQAPAHYRTLYSHISKHRKVGVGSVIATLSKYRGVLFVHSERGMWCRLPDDAETHPGLLTPQRSSRAEPTLFEVGGVDIWKIVAQIEEGDVVYRLLKRTRDSLSFVQICQKIAEARGIDWHELQDTGFLNAEDERLKRLDNGHFALREWFDDPVSTPTPRPPEFDGVAEIEPVALGIGNQADSPPPPTVPKGLVSKMRAVVHRILGFVVRWIQRRSDG